MTQHRRCRACGEGTVEPIAKPGRTWQYKRLTLEVPEDFEIPTCSNCGEEWLNPKLAKALDDVLQVQYREAIATRLADAIDKLAAFRSQRRIEQLLGLSQGYLSKLLSGTKTPSESLLTALMIMARDPEVRLQEAEELWSQPVTPTNASTTLR